MAIVKFQVSTENISGLKLLDLDTSEWAATPVKLDDWKGKVSCIKADDEYFLVHDSAELLEDVFVDDNKITEFEALGLRRMVKKYLTDHCKISVA